MIPTAKPKDIHLVSIITPIMDRLVYFQKTLGPNLDTALKSLPHVEFVVLNYGSSYELDDWIKTKWNKELQKGLIRYFQTPAKTWNPSHAKNVGHKLAKGDVLLNLDCDNFLSINFLHQLLTNHQNGARIGYFPKDTGGFGGRISVDVELFNALHGYNEIVRGYGYDDVDFKLRAKDCHMKSFYYEQVEAKAIAHDYELRVARTGVEGNWEEQSMRNKDALAEWRTNRGSVANLDGEWGVGNVYSPTIAELLPAIKVDLENLEKEIFASHAPGCHVAKQEVEKLKKKCKDNCNCEENEKTE